MHYHLTLFSLNGVATFKTVKHIRFFKVNYLINCVILVSVFVFLTWALVSGIYLFLLISVIVFCFYLTE